MKPEPLKNKEKIMIEVDPSSSEPAKKILQYFLVKDVELATRGLLKEIEKETNEYLKAYSGAEYSEVVKDALKSFSFSVIKIIKKWFVDVVKE